MTTSITISIYGDNSLTVNDVWPDGDAPELIVADHVVALLNAGPGLRHNLREWELLQHLDVIVHVSTPNPAYTGGDPLPGMPEEPRRIETTEKLTT